jgi:hypothetical protein
VRFIRWGLTLLVLAVLAPLVVRLIRFEAGEWLEAHRPVAWCLLGLVWWICFDFSAIGLLLVAIAISSLVHQRGRVDARSAATA